MIVNETNRYAEDFLAHQKEKILTQKKSRFQKWVPTTSNDVRVYLYLLMMMGIIQNPNLRMYFSRKHMLETPFLPNVMSGERFSLLTRFLHFVDHTNKEIAKRDPKLYKILPVSEYLRKKFQKVYIPGKEVSVDESLLLWKGRLSETRGRCVYMDSFYSSPDLFQRLVQRTTDASGTVKITRKGMPIDLKKKLKKGEVVSAMCGKLVALKCNDKRDVSVLTTKHSDEMQPVSRKGGLEFLNKPMCVIGYNKLKDQLLETFLLERKRQNAWYKKLFNRLVNMAALNAYILYCKAGNKKDHLLFRINLVNEIIAKSHGQNLEKCKGRPSDTDMECTRLTGQHFIQENSKTENYKVLRRRCVVCTKNRKRKQTRYRCKNCPGTPSLCLDACFEQ
ncbi:hypothetical protein B7P43_G13170 [Cryptotermes secundus]|uniref:PiggyBac transposable element-derived protein domain-containing protein n=1 Tax=Cryptotermes secundus TaxID=105785 RepID=A0A2J7Q448_9NEOP|nr:hypothetical protein B7P43_G13170 [Cryptotermes secundus]